MPNSGLSVRCTSFLAAGAWLIVAQAILRVILQMLRTGSNKEVTLAACAEVVTVATVLKVAIGHVKTVALLLETWPRWNRDGDSIHPKPSSHDPNTKRVKKNAYLLWHTHNKQILGEIPFVKNDEKWERNLSFLGWAVVICSVLGILLAWQWHVIGVM